MINADDLRAAILAVVERVPVSEVPIEGTISLVDNGTEAWPGSRRAAAKFEGGKWVTSKGQQLSFEPTHWFRVKSRDRS